MHGNLRMQAEVSIMLHIFLCLYFKITGSVQTKPPDTHVSKGLKMKDEQYMIFIVNGVLYGTM